MNGFLDVYGKFISFDYEETNDIFGALMSMYFIVCFYFLTLEMMDLN